MSTLLLGHQVDRLLRYRNGQSEDLARRGLLPHIVLPDGEIRFDQEQIEQLLNAGRRPLRPREVACEN